MSIKFISPKKSVNSAFLKIPVSVENMDRFKLSLANLYAKRDLKKDEMWHTKKKCTQIQNGARLIWQYLSKIPVPHELQQEQITFANQIISAKKTGEDAVELEKQVNEIVYGFYCMANTDEIEAVEPSK